MFIFSLLIFISCQCYFSILSIWFLNVTSTGLLIFIKLRQLWNRSIAWRLSISRNGNSINAGARFINYVFGFMNVLLNNLSSCWDVAWVSQ